MKHSLFFPAIVLLLISLTEVNGTPTITVIAPTGRHASATTFGGTYHLDYNQELGTISRTLFSSYESTSATAIQNTDIELSPDGLFASGFLSLSYAGAGAGGNTSFDLWFTVTDVGAGVPFTFQATTSDNQQGQDFVYFAGENFDFHFGWDQTSHPISGTHSGVLRGGTYVLRAVVGGPGQAVSFRLTVGAALPVAPQLTVEPLGSGAFHLSFQTASTVSYQLQRSDDLTNWTDVGSPLVGDGAPNTISDTQVHLSGYWRMRMQF